MDSDLNSILGISGLENVTMEGGDSIFIEGSLKHEKFCPQCGGQHLYRQTRNHRLFHLPTIGGKTAKVQVIVQKRRCLTCNHVWWPKVPFAHGKQRISQSYRFPMEKWKG